MDSRRLRGFVAVAEAGGISAASEVIGCAQSSLSTLLRHLEQDLGSELLTRSHAGTHLTEAGQRLLPLARQALELDEQMRRAVGARPARLRIGALETIAGEWLPDVLSALAHTAEGTNPDVTLTVGTRGHLAGELAAGRLDVAFVFDNGDPATGPHRVVARDEVVLVAAPEHPLARTARPSMEQVLRTPFLVAEPGCTSDMLVDRFGQDLTRGLPVAMVTGSFGALRRLAAHGSGIALLPYLAAVRDVEAGDLVLIDIEQTLPPLNVEARWRDGVAGPDRALLDIVLDLTRRHRPPERRPGALTGHRVGPASP